MTQKAKRPAPPKGLGAAGRDMWTKVIDAYELRADELRLLEDACRTADSIDQLSADMKDQPTTTTGVGGQLRVHPLLPEIRQQRIALAGMFKQLKLPDEPGDERSNAAGATRSTQARAAANARWSRRGTA